jgi:hypothetical protein
MATCFQRPAGSTRSSIEHFFAINNSARRQRPACHPVPIAWPDNLSPTRLPANWWLLPRMLSMANPARSFTSRRPGPQPVYVCISMRWLTAPRTHAHAACRAQIDACPARWGRPDISWHLTAVLATILSPVAERGGRPCTAIVTPGRPFEPTSKRRRGFPLASPASSAATASLASILSSSRSLGVTILVRADQAAAFRRCCRGSGRFDGAPAGYYVRDRHQ